MNAKVEKGAAVVIRGLRKSFGKQTVLDGVDLSVQAGTVFALLGPNGAGKTTLINILSTLMPPDAGSVTVAGHDLVRDRTGVKQAISLTGQYAAVDEILTGAENLQMMSRLNGLRAAEARSRTRELLERFDLVEAADKRVKSYSGGMRRRLDLAISLIATPEVIFLDEPTTGLDTRSRQDLWAVIRGLVDQGVTILLTTQYLEEADQLADRIAVINHGRVVAEGTAAELKGEVGGDVIEIRDATGSLIDEVATDGTIQQLQAVIERTSIETSDAVHIGIRKPTMDDVFLALTTHPSATDTTDTTVATDPELEIAS